MDRLLTVLLACAGPKAAVDTVAVALPDSDDTRMDDSAVDDTGPRGWQDVWGGEETTCALSASRITCWGLADPIPDANLALKTGAYSSAHASHDICALTNASEVECWGPVDGPGVPIVQMDAAQTFFCGLDALGFIHCWDQTQGTEGHPETGGWKKVDAGYAVSCALSDHGELACWGLDDGSVNDHGGVTEAPTGETFIDVSAGRNHACAQRPDGSLMCWGQNDYGQSDPPSGTTWTHLTVGYRHACALDEQGLATCWGTEPGDGNDYEFGQVADTPVDLRFQRISAGQNHTCGITLAGELSCWGRGDLGQLDVPDPP